MAVLCDRCATSRGLVEGEGEVSVVRCSGCGAGRAWDAVEPPKPPSGPLRGLSPAELQRLRKLAESATEGQLTLPSASVLAMVEELEEGRDVICWGVDCVHQAAALDASYAEYCKTEAPLHLAPQTELDGAEDPLAKG